MEGVRALQANQLQHERFLRELKKEYQALRTHVNLVEARLDAQTDLLARGMQNNNVREQVSKMEERGTQRVDNSREDEQGKAQSKALAATVKDLQQKIQSLEIAIQSPPSSSKQEPAASDSQIKDSQWPFETSKFEASNPEPTAPPSQILDVKQVRASIEKQGEYELAESVYDAGFFIGIRYLGVSCSLLLLLGLLINMVMQVPLLIIFDAQFVQPPFPDDYPRQLELWRASDGHGWQAADPTTGASLISRVCNQDPTLSTASGQTNTDNDLDNYLQSDQGKLLCRISILLWTFCCVFEMRKALEFILSLTTLPISKGRTLVCIDGEGLRIAALSLGRLAFGVIVALVRVAVAVLLLIYGSRWLATTPAMTDLLLNASALGFVLDIDETIYGVVSSVEVIKLMKSIQPLPLPARNGLFVIPVIIVLCSVAFMVVIEHQFVNSMTSTMSDVVKVLCSPQTNLDFISGINALGWFLYAKSPPYSETPLPVVEARVAAFRAVAHDISGANWTAQDVSPSDIIRSRETLATLTTATSLVDMGLEATVACKDISWDPDPKVTSDPRLGARLGVATGISSLRHVTTCAEVKQFCAEPNMSVLGKNVRFACPITCGCADPLSGLWDLARPEFGCPQHRCMPQGMQAIYDVNNGCTNMDVKSLNGTEGWRLILERWSVTGMITSLMKYQLERNGCEALSSWKYADPDFELNPFCTVDVWDSNQPRFAFNFGAGMFCRKACCMTCVSSGFCGPVGGCMCPGRCDQWTQRCAPPSHGHHGHHGGSGDDDE